jgi:glutathione S-transferase
VLIGLAFKGVEANQVRLSYADDEHHSEAFRKLNPRSTVPVLRAGTVTLRDSVAILAWLDRAYPGRPLFGSSSDEAAEIWQIAMECADYLREANRVLLTVAFASHGTLPRDSSNEQSQLQAGSGLLHAECRYLENLLSDGRPFLAGEQPTAADAVAFPEIQLLQRAAVTKNDVMATVGFGYPPDLYPKLAIWKDRLNAMPEVAATVPSHWHEHKDPNLVATEN